MLNVLFCYFTSWKIMFLKLKHSGWIRSVCLYLNAFVSVWKYYCSTGLIFQRRRKIKLLHLQVLCLSVCVCLRKVWFSQLSSSIALYCDRGLVQLFSQTRENVSFGDLNCFTECSQMSRSFRLQPLASLLFFTQSFFPHGLFVLRVQIHRTLLIQQPCYKSFILS